MDRNRSEAKAWFDIGVQVVIRSGVFAGMEGRVLGLDDRGTLRVSLVIFARPVTIELEPWQVDPSPRLTERGWAECTSPATMLASLRGLASDRKLRLFAAACCRRIWQLLRETRSRAAVAVAEKYADHQASQEELTEAAAAAAVGGVLARAGGVARPCCRPPVVPSAITAKQHALAAAHSAARASDLSGYAEAAREAAAACAGRHTSAARWLAAHRKEEAAQCDLLRDFFANPSRPPAVPDATCLGWHEGTVRRLALAIYEGGTFDCLPILADALEEAGCVDTALLNHCRSTGPHTRGCWAMDVILGRS